MKNQPEQLAIYQAKSGKIEFRGDFKHDTVWGSLTQLAELFGRDKSTISRHIKNILKSRELEANSVVAKIATTAADGKKYQVNYYNLDMILSVGYRVDSQRATQFRVWATKTLKQHLLQGYTINKERIGENYEKFINALAGIRAVLPSDNQVGAADVLELVNAFAGTWFSLDAYDRDIFPKDGSTKKQIYFTADVLVSALQELKKDLIAKKQASELFGQERTKESIHAIIGNIFQTFGGQDVYPSIEKKLPIYYTLWLRIIPLWMAIREAALLLLSGFYVKQGFSVQA